MNVALATTCVQSGVCWNAHTHALRTHQVGSGRVSCGFLMLHCGRKTDADIVQSRNFLLLAQMTCVSVHMCVCVWLQMIKHARQGTQCHKVWRRAVQQETCLHQRKKPVGAIQLLISSFTRLVSFPPSEMWLFEVINYQRGRDCGGGLTLPHANKCS